MLNWFKGKTKPAPSGKVLLRAFCMDGVVIGGSEINLPPIRGTQGELKLRARKISSHSSTTRG